jgi:1-deoxy-D-xylulose-5-phosphate reductoisomerase
VDSEHSAIFQSLSGAQGNPVERIHLTASGGPFRTWSQAQIASARKEDALKHPNWEMGAKITIDSATMMNKGFEVIEAKWLFDVPVEKIHVVVHPESIIHSMVEFSDVAVIAQLGMPDMRVPIALALSWPERLPLDGKRLNFSDLKGLSFFEPDREKFPCLQLAFDALAAGGNIPCAMNAANEYAVAAFLRGAIGLYDIPRCIDFVMGHVDYIANPSLDDVFVTHAVAANKAENYLLGV